MSAMQRDLQSAAAWRTTADAKQTMERWGIRCGSNPWLSAELRAYHRDSEEGLSFFQGSCHVGSVAADVLAGHGAGVAQKCSGQTRAHGQPADLVPDAQRGPT